MKYIVLLWMGLRRKRARTTIMTLQIMVTFVLFGLLQGLKSGLSQAIDTVQANVYYVTSAEGGTPLPLALQSRILAVQGVRHVYAGNLLATTYQNPSQQIVVFATDVDAGWVSDLGVSISSEALRSMERMRPGALASRELMAKYGWRKGDHIPLNSRTLQRDGGTDWEFELVGTFKAGSTLLDHVIIVNNAYVDEARLQAKGTVSGYVVDVADVHEGTWIAQRIDLLSANSSFETITQPLRAMAQSDIQSLGDLNFIVCAVMGAAMFALLVSTGAMMMQSARERSVELGVLKALGFSDARIFVLLLAEAMAVSMTAAAVGLAAASRIIPVAGRAANVGLSIPYSVVLAGLGMALALALACSLLPAWRGSRLRVAEALGGR